jgi:hypothetical protein
LLIASGKSGNVLRGACGFYRKLINAVFGILIEFYRVDKSPLSIFFFLF